MFDNEQFEQYVSIGNPTGEVIGIERFLITVKGLSGSSLGALVLFQNGNRGIVWEIGHTTVIVLSLESESMPIGTVAVLQDLSFMTPVGEGFIGRIVSPLARPLDGKGDIVPDNAHDVFADAPGVIERSLLNEQLYTGVSMVDTLFPIVLGQRIAVMGDTKAGKSSFLTQLVNNQTGSDRIVVYVMIGKRQTEISQLVSSLEQSGAMAQSIIVAANIFDSLAQSYVAPYVGCAMAEYLWQCGKDVVVVYDDLSSHAKVYRELSLIAKANPGRESYPGDMFHAHSSLLERAGKLSSNEKTLTALPVVTTPGDDITAYLPTSIMSITDGQIIFDLASFRQNIRPAVNVGLSVSRVGGRAQSNTMKGLTSLTMERLASFRQAQEFAHFGSDMSDDSKHILELGRQLFEMYRQTPLELWTPMEQMLMLRAIIDTAGTTKINVQTLKLKVRELASQTDEQNVEPTVIKLRELSAIEGTI